MPVCGQWVDDRRGEGRRMVAGPKGCGRRRNSGARREENGIPGEFEQGGEEMEY